MFCIKTGTCLLKGNLVFNLMYDKSRFDGDFFVRPLDARMERSARTTFFFPDKMVSFLSSLGLFSYSLPRDSSLIWISVFLSMRRLSTSTELSRVKFCQVRETRCKQNMQITRNCCA